MATLHSDFTYWAELTFLAAARLSIFFAIAAAAATVAAATDLWQQHGSRRL